MVAVGLAVSGIATYAFLSLANHALSPDDYAAVGVLWSLLFAVGNGVMQPLEQEVARAVSERRAKGIGAGPVVRRAALIGAGFTVALVVGFLACEVLATAGLWPETLTLSRLLDGKGVLVAAFLVGMVGFCVAHLTRGTLAANGRFPAYASFFGIDGLSRVVLAVALGIVGVTAVGPWAAVMVVAPFLGVGAALRRPRGLLEPGPEAPWRELSRALGWLLLGTVALALVVQGGTIAVDILATDDQAEAAGVFLNGLVIARIPLFLFQAVLASLLPRLSRLASSGEVDDFQRTLHRLVGVILGVGVVTTLLAAAFGPTVLDALFRTSPTATLGPRDLGLLAATFIIIMAAICLDQALIALGGHRYMAVGWLIALLVFVAVTAAGDDLFLRVELGLLSASVVAFAWLWAWLKVLEGRHRQLGPVSLAESLAEVPFPE